MVREFAQAVRVHIATRLLGWGILLQGLSTSLALQRDRLPVLLFFHGYALAHTIRTLVMARALRDRGYRVELAGRGPHVVRARHEGFAVHDVETLPQSRMDQFVSRGEYEYYDLEWIDRCVRSERMLINMLQPALVIHDMKPTAALSARLEGVDDARVTQAYNQPRYPNPIHLPEYFSTEGGPFAQYLAVHAAEAKPQASFYFLADAPDLHPIDAPDAGYHYVGPLLDRPPEPPRLDILDSGWDTSLPLIYVTCGSSGRPPDYLPELVKAVASRPYRLLITTAGRWPQGDGLGNTLTPDNVRVTDFLPGEWILRRADLLVGVVGVGAVYQALAQGVPIVGSPEHLDHEYHLNRIEVMGLGLKLPRHELCASQILRAVDTILADAETYRRRCAPLAQVLERYPDGSPVADLVDAHFLSRDSQYRVDQAHLTPAGEFMRYLDTTTPPDLSRDVIGQMVKRGMARGMPHVRRGRELRFDHLDSWNWLYDNEPHFFESDYRACQKRRDRFFAVTNGRLHCRSIRQHYRATYTFRLLPRTDDSESGSVGDLTGTPARRLKVFLPYPLTRRGHQSGVRLLSCSPASLEDSMSAASGFMYGHVVAMAAPDDQLEFSYTVEVDVREQTLDEPLGPARLSTAQRLRYLDLDPRISQLPEVIQFRQQLGIPDGAGDEERSRAIYDALAHRRRFRKTRDRTQNPVYSTSTVVRQGGGHCITLSRAFISLCRSEGIPAREVTGALIGYPVDDNACEMRTYGEPVFGHTWAEIHLDGRGWVPIEFHGIVIGTSAMTKNNVRDQGLKQLIRDNSPRYHAYYFGHLDNQRLVCSNSVKRIPQCLVEDPGKPVNDRERWQPLVDRPYECSLRVESA